MPMRYLIVFLPICILIGAGTAWALHHELITRKPYYAVGIVAGLISFLPMIVNFAFLFGALILPAIAVIAVDRIRNREYYGKQRSFATASSDRRKPYRERYPEVFNAIGGSVSRIDDGSWGFIRFRPGEVSEFVFGGAKQEATICRLGKPLESEGDIMALTDELCQWWKPSLPGNCEWFIADHLWRDERGPYRILAVFTCDHSGGSYRNDRSEEFNLIRTLYTRNVDGHTDQNMHMVG